MLGALHLGVVSGCRFALKGSQELKAPVVVCCVCKGKLYGPLERAPAFRASTGNPVSFRITEEYVQAALDLELAGYCWQPGPGDWLLDRDDHSIGMLTTRPVDAPRIRRLNTHLPTHAQVDEMLAAAQVTQQGGRFVGPGGATVAEFPDAEAASDPALCRLKALAAWYRSRA